MIEILNSKFYLQHWTLGPRELSTFNVGRFFPSANLKVSRHMWEKTYRTYVRSTEHKKLLMQQENKLFLPTKTTNSPSFLPGIIEWVKFMSVHENNLLWRREQMNGKKIKMRTGESCYLSWNLFLESPGNCLGWESCFAFCHLCIQHPSFNTFENDITKLSVNKARLTGLCTRNVLIFKRF